MIVANPLQVKAIAHAHVKTDKIDAVLASLRAANFLAEIWLSDAEAECLLRGRKSVLKLPRIGGHLC